jgi:hypothetical protein
MHLPLRMASVRPSTSTATQPRPRCSLSVATEMSELITVEAPSGMTFDRLQWIGTLAGTIVFTLVAALAFDSGGYAPTSWGWSAPALLWLVGLVLVFGIQVRLGVLALAALLGLTGVLVRTLLGVSEYLKRSSISKRMRP